MIYFTADTHFGHTNIIKYCNRPFKSVDEMNESLIEEWNKVVGEDDTIYHLGDFSWDDIELVKSILKRLNGKKFFCFGSHDKHMSQLSGYFKEMKESFLIKTEEDQFIFLNHYIHKEWHLSHYGAWHLFGHSHGRMDDYAKEEGKLLDVGVDSHNFKPWSLDEVKKIMESRPLNFNDRRRFK
ncbi:MAG: phosphoesterase [Patescibacteria group bacterium]|nr:phosphoesterase [Patescibacteria group bacterium]MDD5535064.1 phosphoesterase [Patescibacteria group bacterium]